MVLGFIWFIGDKASYRRTASTGDHLPSSLRSPRQRPLSSLPPHRLARPARAASFLAGYLAISMLSHVYQPPTTGRQSPSLHSPEKCVTKHKNRPDASPRR